MAVTFELASDPLITAPVKNPEFGEKETLDVKSRLHLTMDGTVFTYKNTDGSDDLTMTYKTVKREPMDLLMDFLVATAGRFIKFTDWNSDVRFGRITTSELVVEVLDSLCDLGTTFNFEETVD